MENLNFIFPDPLLDPFKTSAHYYSFPEMVQKDVNKIEKKEKRFVTDSYCTISGCCWEYYSKEEKKRHDKYLHS